MFLHFNKGVSRDAKIYHLHHIAFRKFFLPLSATRRSNDSPNNKLNVHNSVSFFNCNGCGGLRNRIFHPKQRKNYRHLRPQHYSYDNCLCTSPLGTHRSLDNFLTVHLCGSTLGRLFYFAVPYFLSSTPYSVIPARAGIQILCV